MTTTKVTSVSVKSDNGSGSGMLEYDATTLKRSGNISVKWNSGSLSFTSVSDYNIFMSEVMIPLTDIVHNTGAGTGGTVASAGTASTAAVVD